MKNLTKKHWLIIGGAAAVVLAALIIILVVACGGEKEKEYKLGMGIETVLGHANSPTDIQADSTVATVVLDENGKIVSCRIDALQNIATIAEGVATSKNTTSKADLKEGYNMATYGASMDWNGDGKVLEWYLQAQAFEAYVVGKTAAEVEAMPTQTLDNGYVISSEDALLAAGCTIQITEFKKAVVNACNDDQGMTFKTAKDFTLGVAITAELNSGDTKAATAEAAGTAALYSEYACSVVIDGKIAASLNDAVQAKVAYNLDLTGLALSNETTKRVKKEAYNMATYGASMDNNGDGKVLEWYIQSMEFSKYVVGKTGAEVAGLQTQFVSNHHISTDSALLTAGCTIQITGIKAVVAASVTNAR